MCSTWVHASYLDASALVKLYYQEIGSKELKEYLHKNPTWHTTVFCFYEALNALKWKWLNGHIVKEEYLNSTFEMAADVSTRMNEIEDINFLNRDIFMTVQKTAKTHDLDLSDAFQIESIKKGFFSGLAGESKTILVTADRKLAIAAINEGIRAWNILVDPIP